MPVVPPESFIRALVRPLVSWCVSHGVRFSQVEKILREGFVQKAEQAIREAQGAFSVSKVSVMTGLHRSEVSRLLAGEQAQRKPHDTLNRVIGLWSSSKRYRNADQKPRDLTYEGLDSEFALLVARVSKEVTHYPILFELERVGAIAYVGNTVRLIVQEYTPQEDIQYGLDLLSADSIDLASAVEANLCKRFSEPSLHLKTSFDNINPQDLPEIRRWILQRGAEFQEKMRDYLAKFDRDASIEAPESEIGSYEGGEAVERARVTVTSFSYAEAIESAKIIAPKKRGRKKCTPR
jgi:hypothetical protein